MQNKRNLSKNIACPKAFILGLCLALAACIDVTDQRSQSDIRQTRQINQAMETFAYQELSHAPETASRLGVRAGVGQPTYKSQLNDRSQAAFERLRLQRIETLEHFSTLQPIQRQRDLTLSFRTVHAVLEHVVEMSAFGHGYISLGFARPYVTDQLAGAYIDLQDLLINRQIIRNRADALDYISRLEGIAGAIEDDRRRMIADANAGIMPPDFILQRMLEQVKTLSTLTLEEETGQLTHPLLTTFANFTSSMDDLTPGERRQLLSLIRNILVNDIVPAYERFADTLRNISERASSSLGIWANRNGADYYETVLKFYTGAPQSPESLHTDGLRLVADLTTHLDLALQDVGLSEGTVGERLIALSQREDQRFPNTPEGRQVLLDTLRHQLTNIQPALSTMFSDMPETSINISEVPPLLEDNAPGGYYAAAPADGSAPATFFINLRNTEEWPAFTLPSLLYHEALPGHHMESALASEQVSIPLIRQLIWLPVYGEGWALYAEDLADELGFYKDDPLGRIGYLQSLLFRAARLVTDTGIHHKRWTYEEAVEYLVTTTGQSRSAMETEVERYSVWPGQAASYMIGRQFIWTLRRRAVEALGRKFDLAAFHATILNGGPRPLRIVEADVDAWIKTLLSDAG